MAVHTLQRSFRLDIPRVCFLWADNERSIGFAHHFVDWCRDNTSYALMGSLVFHAVFTSVEIDRNEHSALVSQSVLVNDDQLV